MSTFRPLFVLTTCTALLGYFFNPLGDLMRFELPMERELRQDRIESKKLPLPVVILEGYKEQHSAQVLEQEAQRRQDGLNPSRKYAVAPYWCPDRAGNILHNLFNTVTWAIITNRTILLQFVDSNQNRNTRSDCERALRRKFWIPVWEDWKDVIPPDAVIPVDIDVTRRRFDEIHTIVLFPQIPDIFYERENAIYRNAWSNHPFCPEYREFIEDLPESQKMIVRGLQSNGLDFLHGMLFREMFVMVPEEERRAVGASNLKWSGLFSVALHSRHVAKADDGSIIKDEAHCLNLLLKNKSSSLLDEQERSRPWLQYNNGQSNRHSNCTVYLLSDRELTMDKLSDWVQQELPFCHVRRTFLVASIEKNVTAIRPIEHGPNPGIGFFNDLALGVQARTAIIGDEHQSSFKLLQELITYDRLMEAILGQETSQSWPDPLLFCRLPQRGPSGYNYGPGSSTYVQLEESLPELFPMKLWRLFRERHSQDVLEHEYAQRAIHSWVGSDRLFSVANITCPLTAMESSLQGFLNQFVWSLVSNRSLLVRSPSRFVDTCLSQLPSWIPRWDEWFIKANLPNPPQRPSLDSKVLEFPAALPVNARTTNDHTGRLFEYGYRFISGMILRDMFKQNMDKYSAGRRSPQQIIMRSPMYSLAVDTRNSPSVSDKKDSPVLACLTEVLLNATVMLSSTSSCTIYILATNNETAQYWEMVLAEHVNAIMETNQESVKLSNCTVHASSPPVCENGDCFNRDSHSFWHSWAWGSRARDAWIGPRRSIIPDEMEYQRVMEARSLGRFPLQLEELATCYTSDWVPFGSK
ncbi:hypothetical protein ACA910_020764 [Epithemia clementina (nom. ined.)]